MKKAALLLLAVGAVALAAASHAAARQSACKPGSFTSGGIKYRTYCGPAHATVHFRGHTLKFKGGRCLKNGKHFSVFIGTVAEGVTSQTRTFFGAAFPAGGDGTYKNVDIGWQLPFGRYGSVPKATFTLSHGRTRGTFSGAAKSTSGNGKATGSFSCS